MFFFPSPCSSLVPFGYCPMNEAKASSNVKAFIWFLVLPRLNINGMQCLTLLCVSRRMRHTLIYFCTVFIFILGLVEGNILCVGVGVDISNFGGGYVAYLVLRLQGNKDASFFGSVTFSSHWRI